MAALFAYLLAIGIFIASGYAGLVWLTNPPSDHPVTHSASSQSHRAESFNRNMRAERNAAAQRGKAANLPAVSGEQRGKKSLAQADKPKSSEPARSQELTSGSTDTNKELARNAHLSSEQTQGVHLSGQGCAPIGLTAQGDLVFPMACREQVEGRGAPGFSDNQSGATQGADKTRQAAKIEAQRSAEASGEHPAPISAPDLSGATGPATRTIQSKSDERTAISRDHHAMRRARPSTRTTNAPSKEERRPPLGRSGTVVSVSNEWFNPLGLR